MSNHSFRKLFMNALILFKTLLLWPLEPKLVECSSHYLWISLIFLHLANFEEQQFKNIKYLLWHDWSISASMMPKEAYRTMPLADSIFQKSSLVSRDLCFYFKKRPLYGLWASFLMKWREVAPSLQNSAKKNPFQINSNTVYFINRGEVSFKIRTFIR